MSSRASEADLHAAKGALSERWLRKNAGIDFDRRRQTRLAKRVKGLARRAVHAVGVGFKRTQGRLTGELCVQVFVPQKFPRKLIDRHGRIPAAIDGVATDVVEAPVFRAAASASPCGDLRARSRPLVPGSSAAHPDVLAGTLGWLCRSTRPEDPAGATYALSCAHVLSRRSDERVRLYQPARADGATAADYFADLARVAPLRRGPKQSNRVDAAIGLVRPSIDGAASLCEIGPIAGIARARIGMQVAKVGRSTGFTTGEVVSVGVEAVVPIETVGALVFVDQVRIAGNATHPLFAAPGDSGALVVDTQSRNAVGLLFATPSNGGEALMNDIGAVIQALDVQLL
jgi:hypothetical protein